MTKIEIKRGFLFPTSTDKRIGLFVNGTLSDSWGDSEENLDKATELATKIRDRMIAKTNPETVLTFKF